MTPLLKITPVLLTLAASPPPEKPEDDPRTYVILGAECLGKLDRSILPYLFEARERGIFPEYDQGWCARQGLLPRKNDNMWGDL